MAVETTGAVRDVIVNLWRERTATPMDLLESLRGTEVAAQNDYAGRVIFEYFQNAVDRAEKSIEITLDVDESGKSATLFFANDGRPVTITAEPEEPGQAPKSDFHSLCAIFRSEKKPGETIGNKGVGFKSAWEFARRTTVYSTLVGANGEKLSRWGFCLHQPLDLTALQGSLFWNDLCAGTKEEAVLAEQVAHRLRLLGKAPSFLFPEYVSDADRHFSCFPSATTVIALEGIEGEENVARLQSLILEFRRARLFFVNQLRERKFQEIRVTTRIMKKDHVDEQVESTGIGDWTIVSANEETFPGWEERRRQLALKAAKLNFAIAEPSLAIAFPPTIESEECTASQGLFFCYLPTQVKVPVSGRVHIHADFLLDIARKHIADNDYNHELLREAARLLVSAVAEKPELYQRDDAASFLSRTADEQARVFSKELETLLFPEASGEDVTPGAVAYLKKAFAERDLSELRHLTSLRFIKSWCCHRYGERHETANQRTEKRLRLIASNNIEVIPLSLEEGVVKERASFSGTKNDSIFLRNLRNEQKPLAHLEVLKAQPFSGMVISTWTKLEEFREFGIKEFKFDQVMASIRSTITQRFDDLTPRTEADLGFCPAKLLNLIVALRRDLQNESQARASSPLQFLEAKGKEATIAQEMAWLPLPVQEDRWLPAFRVLLPDALPTSDQAKGLREAIAFSGLHHLNSERLDSLLGQSGAWRAIAIEIGAWPCLPLDLQRPDRDIKLAFSLQLARDDYTTACEIWSAVVTAWPKWAAVELNNAERLSGVIEALTGEEPWFPLPSLKRIVAVPDVVLTRGQPIKAEFIYEYRLNEKELPLLERLQVRLPEDLPPGRLIRQVKRMENFSPPSDQLRGRYRTLMESLSKKGPLTPGAVPLLVSRNRRLLWRVPEDRLPLWFAGKDDVAWRHYFREEADFLELRPDVGVEWVRSLGVTSFKPAITAVGDELTPDEPMRRAISALLPYLIVIAENSRIGGSDIATETDKVLDVWQRVHVKSGYDVSMLLHFEGIERTVGKRCRPDQAQRDVVFVKEKNEIWHDLEQPVQTLSPFAGPLSQAIFGTMLLADPFEVFLGKNEGDRDEWLQERYGVGEGQLTIIRDRIRQHELSAEAVKSIVSALQTAVPALSDIPAADLQYRWWDTSLYLEHKVPCSSTEIMHALPDVAKAVCGDLDASHHNLLEWRGACKRYADRITRGWLAEHPGQGERVPELRGKLAAEEASAFPLPKALCRYDFDPERELTRLLRDHWSASIADGERLETWLARREADAVAWLRAGQLEKCAAQLGGIPWAAPGSGPLPVVKVGLMTPVTEKTEVTVHTQTDESRRSKEAGNKLRGETAEVLLALETVQLLLGDAIPEDKKGTLWEDLQANWRKIPFRNSADGKIFSETMPTDPSRLLNELHLSKGVGDGLGFDIIAYIEEKDVLAMVEVKDIGGEYIFFSENERRRALQYEKLGLPWMLYGHIHGTGWSNLTDLMLEQARLAEKQLEVKELRLRPKEWMVQIERQ